jgi:hypothetical protein
MREALGLEAARRRHDALVAGFGKHDAPRTRARALEEPLEDGIHAMSSDYSSRGMIRQEEETHG